MALRRGATLWLACGMTLFAVIELVTLAIPQSAHSASAESASYWVTVRQMDGAGTVAAHLVCRIDQRCSGQMSVSTTAGYLRVFVIAMIDDADAFVRFRGDGRSVSCGRWDYTRIPIESPPKATYDVAYLCDAPQHSDAEPEGLGHPVLRRLPALAALRIDVRRRDGERR